MTNTVPLLLTVAAAALVQPSGLVLVQQRATGGPLAGLWEFPGGKVELGETPEAALVRELREELGVEVGIADLRPAGFASARLGQRHLVLLLFRAQRWQGDPSPIVAEQIAWHHPDALRHLPMPEPDYPLVEQLITAGQVGADGRL